MAGVGGISPTIPMPNQFVSSSQRTVQHQEAARSSSSPDGIIDVGDLPDGIIDVGDLPDGIIDVGDLPDGISQSTFNRYA